MNPQDAVDLGREAIVMGLLISAPVLLTGLLVGLVVGLLQALTQVQEQTVAFVPKLIAMVLVMSLSLPWVLAQVIDYIQGLYARVPELI